MKADSLPSEPPGKPKNTGVGSLSLLQGNFPTQELNQDLLHCRQLPYQLSYLGSPYCLNTVLHRSGCVYNTHCVSPEWSFIPIVITVIMVASIPSLVDTGHLSPHQVLMESNTCAVSWRYCPRSQISQIPGNVLKAVILV